MSPELHEPAQQSLHALHVPPEATHAAAVDLHLPLSQTLLQHCEGDVQVSALKRHEAHARPPLHPFDVLEHERQPLAPSGEKAPSPEDESRVVGPPSAGT